MQANIDQLTDFVVQHANINRTQAQLAVIVVLHYLTARLPSPIVGQIKALLDDDNSVPEWSLKHD